MTAAEIQQRVDAWLDARSGWLGQDDARWSLASQWQAVSRQFGADSPAALGVLLGLVRAAWGDPDIGPMKRGLGWWVVIGRRGNAIKGIACDTEVKAMLAALETAP